MVQVGKLSLSHTGTLRGLVALKIPMFVIIPLPILCSDRLYDLRLFHQTMATLRECVFCCDLSGKDKIPDLPTLP